jgi:hypothetical protein
MFYFTINVFIPSKNKYEYKRTEKFSKTALMIKSLDKGGINTFFFFPNSLVLEKIYYRDLRKAHVITITRAKTRFS